MTRICGIRFEYQRPPRGVGEYFELMFMLLMNLWMAGCDKEEVSQRLGVVFLMILWS